MNFLKVGNSLLNTRYIKEITHNEAIYNKWFINHNDHFNVKIANTTGKSYEDECLIYETGTEEYNQIKKFYKNFDNDIS